MSNYYEHPNKFLDPQALALLTPWSEVEDIVFDESLEALEQISAQLVDDQICYVMFDANPGFGGLWLSIDTRSNSIAFAREWLQRDVEKVKKANLEYGKDWNQAAASTGLIGGLPFCNWPSDFKFPCFVDLGFNEWAHFAANEGFQEKHYDFANKYLNGNLVILFWRVIERLIQATEKFPNFYAPCLWGYCFHDDPPKIIQMTSL
jgi:hypothetical protein